VIVAVIVDVDAPVILAVHVNGNAHVGVIENDQVPRVPINVLDHAHGSVPVHVHGQDHGADHVHGHVHGHVYVCVPSTAGWR
jgi:hypothetical protein